MQATIVYRLSQLDKKLVKGSPTFGEAVPIRNPAAEKKSFQEKAREGTFLMWSSIVPKVAWVAMKKEDDNRYYSDEPPKWVEQDQGENTDGYPKPIEWRKCGWQKMGI